MATIAMHKPALPPKRSRPSISTRSGATTVPNDDQLGFGSETTSSEPLVRDSTHILKKFSGNKPSLVIHLHTKFFRFDQQDGSFPYESPMRVLLEHIKNSTVPHEMIDELTKAGVKFYDGLSLMRTDPR